MPGCISGQTLGKTFVVDSGLGWVRNLALSWVQNSNIIRVGSLSPCSSLPGYPVAIDLLQPPVQSILLTCRPCMTGLIGGGEWGRCSGPGLAHEEHGASLGTKETSFNKHLP